MSKNNKIKKRYDRIAPVYDSLELLMEKGKIGEWRQILLKKLSLKSDLILTEILSNVIITLYPLHV
ncbi:MAG: hypothetical protein ACOCUG_02335 [Halanaerobium sp.]